MIALPKIPTGSAYNAYCGIGSRQTPPDIQLLMTRLGEYFAKEHLLLRSGGAPGADHAFEVGCDNAKGTKEIFLPWANFQENKSPLHQPSKEALHKASTIHPRWSNCSPASRKLHARNIHQVLGKNLDAPVCFVVFWALTQNNKVKGGTATAVTLAQNLSIPTFNLIEPKIKQFFEKLILETKEKKQVERNPTMSQ